MNKLRASFHIFIALSILALSGCAALQEGLNKAVLIGYDQVNNFRTYQLAQPVSWGGGGSDATFTGFYSGSPNVNGFWVTYFICDLRNEGSQAQTFTYDVSKFYVEYDGIKHFHKPLQPYTYTSFNSNQPGNPQVTNLINPVFKLETQLGDDTKTFQPGYYPNVGYRFTIFVTKTSPGAVDVTDRLALRFDGYPNVMDPHNQNPVVTVNPTRKADLLTACRPKP